MSDKTYSTRLYRAGSPDEGHGFWTPSEKYARKVHPDAALHEAELQPGFAQRRLLFCRSDALVQKEKEKRVNDVLIFRSFDGREEEYVLLNPNAIKIVQ